MDSPGRSTRSPQLVDKAEWYMEQTEILGLPVDHSAHHLAFFLRWLHDRELTSRFFREDSAEQLDAIQAGRLTWPRLILDHWDGCLISEIVTSVGNDFGAAYLSHARGRFWDDYAVALTAENRRAALSAPFSEENFAKLAPIFDQRLAEWKSDPASAIKPLGIRGKIGAGYVVVGTLFLISGLIALVVSLPVHYFGSKTVAGFIRLGSFMAMVVGLAMFGVLILFAYASRRRKALREKRGVE